MYSLMFILFYMTTVKRLMSMSGYPDSRFLTNDDERDQAKGYVNLSIFCLYWLQKGKKQIAIQIASYHAYNMVEKSKYGENGEFL